MHRSIPILIATLAAAFQANAATFKPESDNDSLLRNPASGWILYDDAAGKVADAGAYWKAQDQAAREHASIFYLRWRWAEAEPEEGHYAWKENANFKALIEGARSRGLRLAFRFYVCGWDNAKQATPDYVFAAGAKGQPHPGGGGTHLTPNADDPIFRKKYEAFLDAFAKEFDDPSRVDFIDGSGLGRWGENHTLTLADKNKTKESMEWVAGAYAARFKHTLLGWQMGRDPGPDFDYEKVINGRDFVVRRDALGSEWFNAAEVKLVQGWFPRHPLFAERCYWGGMDLAKIARESRQAKEWKTWQEVDTAAVDQALEARANTLDMRTVQDTARFLTYPDLVMRFRREGGYRLAPVEVTAPDAISPGGSFKLHHVWRNPAVGVLPNLNTRWASKYRPAWTLLDRTTHQPVMPPFIAKDIEPGTWVKGTDYPCDTTITVPRNLVPGTYDLACGIVNTAKDGMPDLQLALKSPRHGSWHVVGAMQVKR